jgi:4a-hydroxytetrahydrobiopterin dehydratase
MADDTPRALTPEELNGVLQQLPGWGVVDGELAKEFRFKDFVESVSFVNRLVPYFESKDHHPDIRISYSRVTFALSRHDIGRKVTALDGEVAKHIEHEYSTSRP